MVKERVKASFQWSSLKRGHQTICLERSGESPGFGQEGLHLAVLRLWSYNGAFTHDADTTQPLTPGQNQRQN